MTGRSPDVDAGPITPRDRSRRVRAAALAVGLLCALGLFAGGLLRGHDTVDHHRAHAVAACASVGDGHGTTARNVQVAVVGVRVGLADSCFASTAATATGSDHAGVTLDSVRTRGPPAGV